MNKYLLFLLFLSSLSAQQKFCTQYLDTLKYFSQNSQLLQEIKANENRAIQLSNMITLAYEEEYIEINKMMTKLNSDWEQSVKKDKKNLNNPRIGDVEAELFNYLENYLPSNQYKLLKIPMVLNGKVISISKDTLCMKIEGTDKSSKSVRTWIQVKVEQVFKGNIIEDVLKFYFLDFWDIGGEFLIGKNYLFHLSPRGSFKQDYKLCLVTYLDNSYGFYPISNGVVVDKYDFYKGGSEITLEKINQFYNK